MRKDRKTWEYAPRADVGALALHADLLERGVSDTQPDAVGVSQAPENQQALAELIGNGFAYTPFIG